MSILEALASAVMDCNVEDVERLTREALDRGVNPVEIIGEGLISGMNVVGKRFKNGEMFVPEVLMAAKAMHKGMDIVTPHLGDGDLKAPGKVILGTVAGDLHDIGKNLVGMMMQSGGLEVVDLGIDVSPRKFVEAVKENKPDVLGLSALLTTTMLAMKETIDLLVEEGLRDTVKIIIGGAPVTLDFAREIGADGWAPDAASAKELAQELVSG